MNRISLHRGRSGFGALLCVLPVLMLVWSGCSSVSAVKQQTRKVADVITFSGGGYKKIIGIMPLENDSFIRKSDFDNLFKTRFFERLERTCPNVIWLKPDDPDTPNPLDRVPRLASGGIDNLALARQGKALGLHAVLLAGLINVDAEQKEKGIMLFRDTHYFGRVQLNIALYSTQTGAKLLDEIVTLQTEVDGAEYEAIAAKDSAGVYELTEALEEIADTGGDLACETVREASWQAFVLDVEGERISFAPGRESGVRTGDTFEVFDSGEIIENRYGQRFLVPGKKTGDIRVTTVFIGKAEAEPLGEIYVKTGFIVRPK